MVANDGLGNYILKQKAANNELGNGQQRNLYVKFKEVGWSGVDVIFM